MPKEAMTPRERWLVVLNRRAPDRVPMDYWATGEATDKLCKHLGCDFGEAMRRLHIDRTFDVRDILGPCHNIQSVGPAENIVAMYETGYEYGWSQPG